MKVQLNLHGDPLGNVYVEWKIPFELIQNNITIELPTYKYVMSKFLGIPVPFSSIAKPITSEIFKVFYNTNEEKGLAYRIEKKFQGRRILKIEFDNWVLDKKSKEELTIQYELKDLIIKDRIFFHYVFPLKSPLKKDIKVDIDGHNRFSYHISSYKVKSCIINTKTGRIIRNSKSIKGIRIGDNIYLKGEDVLLSTKNQIDLHVYGSRLPFFMDRRIIWIIVYLILLLVTLKGLIAIF